MEKERISFFNKLYYSMSRFDYYPKMLKEGVGRAFLYLLFFTLIFGSIGGIDTIVGVKQFVDDLKTEEANELPFFTFTDGELFVEGAMPLIVQEDDTSILIIDTTGRTNPDILDDYQTGVLILNDRLVQKENSIQTSEISFKEFRGFDFDKYQFINWIDLISGFLVVGLIIIFIFYLLFFYLGKMFSALLLSVFGLIFKAIQKSKISYGQLYSAGIYALTLPVIIDIILSLFDYNLAWYFYYAIALIFLWVAIKFVKKAETEE